MNKKFIGMLLVILFFISLFNMPQIYASNENQNLKTDNYDRWALIIGVQLPGHTLDWPSVPARDAEAIKKGLIESDSGNWNESNIFILKDQDATKEAINESFKKIKENITEGDIFWFFYFGHSGKIDGKDPFICPYNLYDEQHNIKNYITAYELNKNISEIEEKGTEGIFITMEGCYSGSFFNGDSSNGRVIFSSTGPNGATMTPYVFGSDGEHISVSKGLYKAISNGKTTAEEISNYAKEWWSKQKEVKIFRLIFIILSIFSPDLALDFRPLRPRIIDNYPSYMNYDGDLQILY